MSSAGARAIGRQVENDALHPTDSVDNADSKIGSHGEIFSENDPNNKNPPAADGSLGAATDLGIASRDTQFTLRDQSISRTAQAAGAQRNENDADLLGFTPSAKRRSASRTLLG